ncbi:MAG TPA: RdgB/HAM1 family non-canonical purine NTP pyrophosphatase [Bryobacteraceae bacterium]|nr:RdgB/HAM1 family non-canonical purine NTP pyrophosphatase [Bryobacteraceae bacterium]HPT28575.1 RdgB/HAM1 family non-canonical purine NTP pyrophosphatase [Bryobacteraceae bacterium]
MKLIRCATTNAGKLREFRLAAAHFGFKNVSIEPIEKLNQLPDCVEDAATFEENAIKKALHYSVYAHRPVFADDSGLAVPALDNAPGVYSARFAGVGATDEANNRLLLERLEGVKNRTAYFVCSIALAHDGRLLGTFNGSVEGRITAEPVGTEGFGYDPLFFHEPFGCTFGQVSAERKMAVSHRGQALQDMLSYVCGNL